MPDTHLHSWVNWGKGREQILKRPARAPLMPIVPALCTRCIPRLSRPSTRRRRHRSWRSQPRRGPGSRRCCNSTIEPAEEQTNEFIQHKNITCGCTCIHRVWINNLCKHFKFPFWSSQHNHTFTEYNHVMRASSFQNLNNNKSCM